MNKSKRRKTILKLSVIVVLIIVTMYIVKKYDITEDKLRTFLNDMNESAIIYEQLKEQGNSEISLDTMLSMTEMGSQRMNTLISILDDQEDDIIYRYTGIVDRSMVKSVVMECVEPEEKYFAMLIRLKRPEDAEYIIEQMKTNMHPEQLVLYDEETDSDIAYLSGVSANDMIFYSNKEYIFVSYVEQSLVENGKRRSSEDMIKTCETIISELYKE